MITVLGAEGFIGSHLVRRLQAEEIACYLPQRDENLAGKELGQVIYCIGLTSDFRTRPYQAVESHVCKLLEIIQTSSFDSLLYLSSTRLYEQSGRAKAYEDEDLAFNPLNSSDIYGLSKAMGESMTLALGAKGRIVRLSNVYGVDFSQQNFLSAILKEAMLQGTITLETTPASAKDYISVSDVVKLLPKIALSGRERIYNIASGVNITNEQLTSAIERLTGCKVTTQDDAASLVFPEIDITRIGSEFDFAPASLFSDLPELVKSYKQYWSKS